MPSPIHIQWWNRPGWGEYRALRGGKPNHWGFDTYTLPKATIYGTAEGGVVKAKGFAGSWGHYIDVYYPKSGSRAAYYERSAHMNEASGLRIGATVGTGTALGRVGRTGNAAGIFWPAPQSPNGKELWHVHSQCYLAASPVGSKLTNPLPLWGVTTAGGGITPITPNKPETAEEDDDMLKPELVQRNEGTAEYSLVAPWLVKKGDTKQQGYIVLSGEAEAKAAARLYGRGFGNHTAVNRADYIAIQGLARIAREQWLAAQPASTVVNNGSVDLSPVLDAIAAVPKNVNDDAAARLAQ